MKSGAIYRYHQAGLKIIIEQLLTYALVSILQQQISGVR